MKLTYQTIAPFLAAGQNKLSRILSYVGLGVGVLLLLCCLQMYLNIDTLLTAKDTRKNGFDFLSVTKTVTEENMGKDNRFTAADIEELNKQPFLDGAAPLKSNSFKVLAGAGSMIPFSTDIFVEAIDQNFIDTVPASFQWRPGQETVPVIFASDFLEMYNVFAPSWDLPQLSEQTAMAINVFLRCHGHNGERVFKAQIVAFSDRINSVLVPESFLNQMNKELDNDSSIHASRAFLKTANANNPDLLSFLEKKKYHVNKDKTKFGKTKQVLQAIFSGLAAFGVLVIVLAMVLFSFYLQLMIARSKQNLELLLMLGYSPKWLGNTVSKKWIPVYISIVGVSLAVTQLFQWLFSHFSLNGRAELSPLVHWSVVLVSVVLIVLSIAINFRMMRELLRKMQS